VSEKFTEKSERSFVSDVSEAAFLLRRIAEPRPVGDSVKSAINRAAHRVSLPPGRVEDLWYGEARMVRSREMDAIRAVDQTRQAKEARGREQAVDLRAFYAAIIERLRQIDADFHSHDVAALLDAIGALGDVGRSVAKDDESD